MTIAADDVMTVAPGDASDDKLDQLIVDIMRSAGGRGLTKDECTVLICDWAARSGDPELQALADADPGFRAWRMVKVPSAKELQ